MATEIQFLREQLLEKKLIIRILFMSKSVNRDNDDFSYNSRNIKNPVDNTNINVTASSAHKSNSNTDKSVKDSKTFSPHHLSFMTDPKLIPCRM